MRDNWIKIEDGKTGKLNLPDKNHIVLIGFFNTDTEFDKWELAEKYPKHNDCNYCVGKIINYKISGYKALINEGGMDNNMIHIEVQSKPTHWKKLIPPRREK